MNHFDELFGMNLNMTAHQNPTTISNELQQDVLKVREAYLARSILDFESEWDEVELEVSDVDNLKASLDVVYAGKDVFYPSLSGNSEKTEQYQMCEDEGESMVGRRLVGNGANDDLLKGNLE
ncbi:hypothetical protein HK098_006868, partial [Nowakowskiella sp. JEL0407]